MPEFLINLDKWRVGLKLNWFCPPCLLQNARPGCVTKNVTTVGGTYRCVMNRCIVESTKNQSSNMSVIITNANLLFINVLYTNTSFYVVTKLNIPIFSHNSLLNSAERHFIGVFIPGWDMLMVRQQLCLCATCMCWHVFDVNYSYTSNLCMTTARIHNHCKCTN